MKLKAPAGTTYARGPNSIYPLDKEGCIEVADNSPDITAFESMGFKKLHNSMIPLETAETSTTSDEGEDNGDI